MSQCDRVYEVLRDGDWHTITEIHARAGTMRLNSRVAELRARRGLTIEHAVRRGDHSYRLVSTEAGGDPSPVSGDAGSPLTMDPGRPGVTAPGRSGSDPEQLELVA